MKKLLAVLAIAGLGTQALADNHGFSSSADMRVRAAYNNNKTDTRDSSAAGFADTDHYMDHRIRLGLDFNKGEKTSAHLGLLHADLHGSNSGTDQVPSNAVAADGDTENDIIVNEAYLNWMATDSLLFQMGRASVTLADGKVISSNEYQQIQKAFDGMQLGWDQDWGRIGLFTVRGLDTAGSNVEGHFYGLSADFKMLPDFIKTAHLHYIIVDSDVVATQEESSRIGVTLGGDAMGIDYNFTYAMNSGEFKATSTDIEGTMMDVEVGYSMPDMMNFRVHVGYHTDSGTSATATKNETYRPFHYDVHYNAGLMDMLAWGNLTYMHAGVSLEPMESLSVALDYYTFSKTEKGTAYNTVAYGTVGGVATGANITTSDELGSEIDLTVTKSYGDDFDVEFRYGQFSAGDAFAASTAQDAAEEIMITFNKGF